VEGHPCMASVAPEQVITWLDRQMMGH
jgi:hypothetical protein